jgi:farnesyl diphosphate synthase
MADDRSFSEALSAIAIRVEQVLDAQLAPAPRPNGIVPPSRLLAAMRHAALGGGKRLRPFLVWAASRLFQVPEADALRAGAALELVHVYSLVHDDLPAMDNDDIRRGKPTLHRAFDEATAILAGDALLTLAFDILADGDWPVAPATRCDLVALLARAAGPGGMVGGQMLDLAAEGRFGAEGARPDADGVRRLQAMKTGAMLRAAVLMGARLGSADAAATAALDVYGRALGAAFQIADDILDVEGEAAVLGKATGKDDASGKATLPNVLGIAAARREAADQVAAAQTALHGFGREADLLRAAARFTVARDR